MDTGEEGTNPPEGKIWVTLVRTTWKSIREKGLSSVKKARERGKRVQKKGQNGIVKKEGGFAENTEQET